MSPLWHGHRGKHDPRPEHRWPGGPAASDITGTVASASAYNLIGTGGSGGLTNGVNGNQVGVANPLLGPLAR